MDSVLRIPAWGADGVIAGLWEGTVAEKLAEFRLPVVDVFDWTKVEGMHRVGVDDVAVGRAAAEFLRERRLPNVAFVGQLDYPFGAKRYEGFRSVMEGEGLACSVFKGSVLSCAWEITESAAKADGPLAEFLRELPKPVGVFAANDDIGLQVLDAARFAGLRVPDEVAVLGVDDDPLLCALAHPPLSSVALRAERVGVAAARVLGKLMDAGEEGTEIERETWLPPAGVTARLSTDVLAVEDEDLAAALRWLRENASRNVKVYDVLREVPLSRRSLELKFAKLLGRSPHEELTRVRVERAKSLLSGTDLPMAAVARRSGFAHAERMATVFRGATKETPTAYRRRFRGGEG
jgi:LacI family transcriptional regulator